MLQDLAVLISVILLALAVAGWALAAGRSRRQMIGRALDGTETTTPRGLALIKPEEKAGLGDRIRRFLPPAWSTSRSYREKLIQAGFDATSSVLTFNALRLATMVAVPAATLLLAPFLATQPFLLLFGWALIAGFVLPVWYLNRRVIQRQVRIRRSIPDALDLLVVCVEAGMSLDAALQRVGRDMQLLHPELARELLLVNRRTNAGVPREEALRQVYGRTGVDEIRTLVSSMIQSERWGTSIGRVLRVYAESLRRKRRQTAERNAAVAPLKMIIPLALMILPALFVVIMGPAAIQLGTMLSGQ